MISNFVVMFTETTQLFSIQMTMDTVSSLQKYQSSSSSSSELPITAKSLNDNWMNMEAAIIAANDIPPDVSTLPFVSSISLRRILSPKPVNCFFKV